MPPEFDDYAGKYSDLLQDPIRNGFASNARFFAQRKLSLIQEFYRKLGIDTSTVSWLDVGCGQGELLKLGQPYFGAVAGCDPSGQMFEKCQGLGIRQQDSATRLPFDDSTFDLLTVVCVYHHVRPKFRAALTREALRVLKPGGMLCMIEHNPYNPVTQLIVRRCPVDVDAELLTAKVARSLLLSSDLQFLETRYFLYFPERIYNRLPILEELLRHIPFGGQFAVFGRKR